tara:strand:+ start:119 stop:571 length:453 start_codon:yes stop_codon:yes gene_type:complete
MIKKIFLTFLVILLFGCSYKPIYSESEYGFSFKSISSSGNSQINRVVTNNLERVKGKNIKYKINFNSIKEKKIISKDAQGDPSIFELKISINFQIIENKMVVLDKNLIKKNTYNNISDKFELEKYEDIVTKNLASNMALSILNTISNIEK